MKPRAERDLNVYYLWAARNAPATAARWHERFQNEILSLANNPTRCGFATENADSDEEIRELLFGKRPNVFRALFIIQGDLVVVLRVRRAVRRRLTPRELRDE